MLRSFACVHKPELAGMFSQNRAEKYAGKSPRHRDVKLWKRHCATWRERRQMYQARYYRSEESERTGVRIKQDEARLRERRMTLHVHFEIVQHGHSCRFAG